MEEAGSKLPLSLRTSIKGIALIDIEFGLYLFWT